MPMAVRRSPAGVGGSTLSPRRERCQRAESVAGLPIDEPPTDPTSSMGYTGPVYAAMPSLSRVPVVVNVNDQVGWENAQTPCTPGCSLLPRTRWGAAMGRWVACGTRLSHRSTMSLRDRLLTTRRLSGR